MTAGADIQQLLQQAIQHHQAGRLHDAEALYRQVLNQQPDHPDVLHLMGLLASHAAHPDIAADLIRRAIALKPAAADFHLHLAEALVALDKLDEAADACRAAIGLDARYAEAHYRLGAVLDKQSRSDAAIAAYSRAIELRPDVPEMHNQLGIVLGKQGKFDQAVECFNAALALNPDYAPAHQNLGLAFEKQGNGDRAIECYRRALAIKGDSHGAYHGLGSALKNQGRLDEALACFHRALELKHDYPDAHGSLGLTLLLLGDLEQGWREYEWRWDCETFPTKKRKWNAPLWDGSDPSGKTILLHTEQGFGDTIQFIRYAPLLAARGARVIVEAPPVLKPLLERVAGVSRVIPVGESLPPFDLQLPILSLPLRFGTTLQTIPAQVPYISPGPRSLQAWEKRLSGAGGAFKVGLAWAGRPTHPNDAARSITLAQLGPLARIPGIRFYSLQKGEQAGQAAQRPGGLKLIDLTSSLSNFADTAAFIANLDLVISVDTSVVHVAGALARPVWTLLPFAPDWRWLLDRQDSPWYPTMRLFRQSRPADWQTLIQRVAADLARVSSSSAR